MNVNSKQTNKNKHNSNPLLNGKSPQYPLVSFELLLAVQSPTKSRSVWQIQRTECMTSMIVLCIPTGPFNTGKCLSITILPRKRLQNAMAADEVQIHVQCFIKVNDQI